jgi:hypothetical protein
MGLEIEFLSLCLTDLQSGFIIALVQKALLRSPLLVFVALIIFTTVSKLTSGSPRQFLLRKEHRRCSILFHLLVPGGSWPTIPSHPTSSLKLCR